MRPPAHSLRVVWRRKDMLSSLLKSDTSLSGVPLSEVIWYVNVTP